MARSVAWTVWSRGVVQALSLVSTVLVARLLAPADYGLVALAGIWTATLMVGVDLGLGAAIVQFRDLDEAELNTCFWVTNGIAWVAYLALFASADALETWFGHPLLAAVLRVSGLGLVVAAMRVVTDALLRQRLQMDRLSKSEIMASALTVIVVLGLAMAGAGVWALVAGDLVMQGTLTAMSFWFVRWRPGLRMGGRRLAGLFRFGLTLLGARGCWTAYQQVDRLVLGKLVGSTELGLFAMGKQLALLPGEKVSSAVMQVAGPAMASLQDDVASLREALLRGLRLTASVIWPMSVGLMFVGEDAVRLVLTDKWVAAVPIMRLFCVYGAVASVATLLTPTLLARYRDRTVLRYTIFQLVVLCVTSWIGAVLGGGLGVALACTLAYPFGVMWYARQTFQAVGLRGAIALEEVCRILAALGIMSVAVGLAQGIGVSGVEGVVRIVWLVVVGAVSYCMALWWVSPNAVADVSLLGRWMMFSRTTMPGSAWRADRRSADAMGRMVTPDCGWGMDRDR